MKSYIIIVLFVLIGSRVFSAVEVYSERKEGSELVVSTSVPVLTVYDDKFYTMASGSSWQGNFTNYKVNNYFRLGINPQVAQINDMSGSMTLKIKMWKWNSTTNSFQTSYTTQTLSLNYSTVSTALVDEISSYVDQDAHKTEVYITAITGATFDINDVYLSSEIEVERYYTLDTSPSAAPVVACQIDPTNTSYYEFYWGTRTGAEYYELEWVHVSNTSETGVGTLPTTSINYNYYLNSTRVQVKGNSYRIPRIFDSGYIFYRIRAVGYVGTNFDIIQLGAWSNLPESGTYLTHMATNRLTVTGEFDTKMNWSHQVSYGDHGQRFESISFVDGLGRERQGVTHNTETGQAVVSNVYYDKLGRPVITDLPTPVDGEQLKHYLDFNRENTSGTSFNAANFDGTVNCGIIQGAEMSSTTTNMSTGKYYSPNNPNTTDENGLIPDAEKYPYSRVQYKNDFTGRVTRASGVGKDLKPGSTHETVFGYATPNQYELDHMFGAEVGYASHYQKMVTVDANGQVYVQYTDLAGRTIASALAGDGPTAVNALTGNGAQNATIPILPNNTQNVVLQPASSTLSYTEFITQNANYVFNYAFTPQQFQNACMGSSLCLDCEYDLTLKVYGCDGATELFSNTQTLLGHDVDNLCSAKSAITVASAAIPLTIGEYQIVKILSVNQQAIEDKWCTYIDQTNCEGTIATPFNQSYLNQSFDQCDIDLSDDVEATVCDDYKHLMLSDLTPGGQYAQYLDNNGTYSALTNCSVSHSVLTEDCLTANGSSIDKDWKHPVTYNYLTKVATATNYTNVDGSVYTITTLQDFIEHFQPSWAELLLPYHPEFCFYENCVSVQNQLSITYDNTTRTVYTFGSASNATTNYFKPLAGNTVPNIQPFNSVTSYNTTLAPDPFFAATGPGYTLATAMNTAMNNYYTENGTTYYSMWQYAVYQVMCNATGSIQTCLTNNTTISACYKDAIWVAFRRMYQDLKAEKVYQVQNSLPNCSNAQIGVGTWTGKVAIFGNINTLNSVDLDGPGPAGITDFDIDGGGPDLGTQMDQTYVNAQIASACDASCTEYAQDWIDQMVGCEQYATLTTLEKTRLKTALVNLCKGGCDSSHPQGATNSPTAVTAVNKVGANISVSNIDDVMLAFFGSGYEDALCTSLLISAPGAYQTTTAQISMMSKPLDICACTEILQAEVDFNNTAINPGQLMSIEQILAHNTGVSLEDANIMLCQCKGVASSPFDQSNVVWASGANTTLLNSGITIPSDLACNSGTGCTDCATINNHVSTLGTRISNVALSTNYGTILTNYLNNKLLFHLTYADYDKFIAKCNSATTTYCEINPLAQDWADVLTLIAYRNQLFTTSSAPLNLLGTEGTNQTPTNIVYANSDFKNLFLVDNYWSVHVAGTVSTPATLTTYFGSVTGVKSSFLLTIPANASFGFADIISFGLVQPTSTTCPGTNNTFKVQVTYLDCGKINTTWIDGTSTGFEMNKCICSAAGLSLCDQLPEQIETACYQPLLDQLYSASVETYLANIDAVYQSYKEEYNTACANAFSTETLSYTGPNNQYQYTLYFYDQAGNLVKTVAPQGNDPENFNISNVETARDAVVNSSTPLGSYTPTVYPNYTYETVYKYNSYNQLVSTTNPDQDGETKFIYDGYGRIIASQNPVQKDAKKYSYSLYDSYGRPVEVGQAAYNGTTVLDISGNANLKLEDNGAWFKTWVYSCVRSEVTFTLYDKSLNTTISGKFANAQQENLRLRVASVFYFNTVSGATMPQTGYESATHYSYDIHGNVKEQLQDIPMMAPVQQDIKSTQYDYEILSGNMKKVEYQKGKRDRMTHEYNYDKMYRLTEVFTSTDAGVHKSREARYKYYDYGPLARVELGHHKVQGQDYVYTINGWIKGMNSNTLNETRDGGKDGIGGYNGANSRVHELVAEDVVGYSLGYFQNDYKSILASSFEANPYAFIPSTSTVNPYGTAISNLYNGNISHSETAIDGFEVLGSVYKYDQLQQLKSMRVFRSATLGADNSWASSVETTDYSSSYNYDKNGNLTSLTRKATTALGLNMDAFTYAYTTVAGNVSNRLDKVTDGAGSTASILDDIEPGQANGNYTYDKLGQLTNDVQTSGFVTGTQTIFWRTGDKKIQSQLSQTRKLEFIYNAFGQRVVKIEKTCVAGVVQAQTAGTPWKYTYYGYDANGQVMATYSVIMNTVSSNYTANVDELNIYGAGRIGLIESGKSIYNNNISLPTEGPIWVNQLGNKRYELTNHLGNVNAVITDRKMPQSSSYIFTLNTFSTSTDGWTATAPATVTQSNNQLNVNTNASQNGATKAFTTVVGQEYDVVINAIKGGAPNLEFYINGVAYPITSGVTTSITFQAITTSTTINVRATATGSYTFTVQDVTLNSHQKYSAVTIMKADYYPFGFSQPGRTYNTTDYRFGYNGMEKDCEIKGCGNSYTTEFRQYDPRVGRWLSLDPLMFMFPSLSPYEAFDNNPIYFNDPFGLSTGTGDPEIINREASHNGDRKKREDILLNKGKVDHGTVVIFKYPGDEHENTHTYTYDAENNEWNDEHTYNTSTDKNSPWNIVVKNEDYVKGSDNNLGGHQPPLIAKEIPQPILESENVTNQAGGTPTTPPPPPPSDPPTVTIPPRINRTPVVRPPSHTPPPTPPTPPPPAKPAPCIDHPIRANFIPDDPHYVDASERAKMMRELRTVCQYLVEHPNEKYKLTICSSASSGDGVTLSGKTMSEINYGRYLETIRIIQFYYPSLGKKNFDYKATYNNASPHILVKGKDCD